MPARTPARRCERCGKTAYVSKRSALKKLRELAIDRALAVGGEKVPWRPYQAPCGWWHLTSQEKR